MVGAVALSLIPVMVKQRIGGDINVETAISALFAIGIAVGSLSAAGLAHGEINLRSTPAAAVAMAAALIDLGVTMGGFDKTETEMPLGTFLFSATGMHVAFDVLMLSTAGGLFVVPLFAAVQAWAPDAHRARVVAGANVLTALFMVAGSLISSLLLSVLGISEPIVLVGLGLLNLGMAIWLYPFAHEEN